jgi:hypothetical protein
MPEKESTIDQTLRHPLCLGIIFVLAVYLVLIGCYISHYEMNLTALYNLGAQDSAYQQALIDPGVLVYKNYGYDGQYNYYLVKDFPLQGKFSNPRTADILSVPGMVIFMGRSFLAASHCPGFNQSAQHRWRDVFTLSNGVRE